MNNQLGGLIIHLTSGVGSRYSSVSIVTRLLAARPRKRSSSVCSCKDFTLQNIQRGPGAKPLFSSKGTKDKTAGVCS